MNNGKTYIVDRVDEVARHGLCRPPCKLDYYTAVRDKGEIHTQGGQVMFVPHAPGNKKLACAPHWGRATMVKHFLGYTYVPAASHLAGFWSLGARVDIAVSFQSDLCHRLDVN
jgi:hypothetical protein